MVALLGLLFVSFFSISEYTILFYRSYFLSCLKSILHLHLRGCWMFDSDCLMKVLKYAIIFRETYVWSSSRQVLTSLQFIITLPNDFSYLKVHHSLQQQNNQNPQWHWQSKINIVNNRTKITTTPNWFYYVRKAHCIFLLLSLLYNHINE